MNRAWRSVTRVTVGLGVVGGTVMLAATPALAASGSLSVSPSGTVTSAGIISIAGHYDNSSSLGSASLKLTISRPDGPSYTIWTGTASGLSSGSTPTQRLDTSNPPWSSAEAVNGTYSVNFSVGSSSAAPVTVTLRVPPADVTGFGGSASGTVAHFSWSANSEPDLAGYDLIDVTDSSRRDLTPGGVDTSVCSGGSCAVDIDFGSGAAGTTRSFVIEALRYTSPSHSGVISSGDSAHASITFAAPSAASGGSGGTATGGGTTTGGGSAGTGGGSVAATGGAGGGSGGRPGPAIRSNHPGAALRAYLPTSLAGAAPDLPAVVTEVKPLPQGSYKPTLAYPDQTLRQPVQKRSGSFDAVGTDIARVLDVGALWKALAGAALVLLVAAHLRAWITGLEPLDR